MLWEALLVGALFGGLLLSFISMRGRPSPSSACQQKACPPPALRPPGTFTGGTGERRKSVTFVPHSTPPSQRRQRQAMQEALAQRSVQLWERSDLAERRRLAEQEERARRDEEVQRRSLAAEETKRIIGAILSSPICTGSEHNRWERDGAGARRRSSVDSGFSARIAVPKREWRTRSDEVHRHHQPAQQQQAAHMRQAGSGDSEHGEGTATTTATPTAVEGNGNEGGDNGEEETDILVYIQKALKREQDEVNRIEEELRKIEEENLQIEAELSQGSDSDDDDSGAHDSDADRGRRKGMQGDHGEEYESGDDDREDDGEWGQAEMEEEMRSMEDEIQMIEEEQRFLEEENRKIEQELREEALEHQASSINHHSALA